MTSLYHFPVARFASLIGVHSTLLLFTALYLPRSSFLLQPIPEQASSKDRPQHPFLRPLTADPLLTLTWLCIGVGAVQISWSSWMKIETQSAQLNAARVDEETRIKSVLKEGEDRYQTMKDAVLSTLTSTFFIHVLVVVFGAPIISHFSKTYLLAMLLALLVIYPPVYMLRSPSLTSDTKAIVHRLTWLRLFAEFSIRTPYERLLVFPPVGAVVGAWGGAFPIALDWDRPWQAWPLTPAYGAIIGYIIGLWSAFAINITLVLADADRSAEEERTQPSTASNSPKARKSRRKAR